MSHKIYEPEQVSDEFVTSLSRVEVMQGLRYSVMDGAFATVWTTLTSGAILTGFALWLGAGSVAIGLLTAIPTLAALVQLVSSFAGERSSTRKSFIALYSFVGRVLWLPILLLPLFMSHARALTVFLVLFTISNILVNMPTPAWTAWMTDLVPVATRGRYFGYRNMVCGLVGMLIGLPAGWYLDEFTYRHPWQELGFGALFAMGVVGGILSVYFLTRQPEAKRHRPSVTQPVTLKLLIQFLKQPLKDKTFRALLIFNTVFGVGQNVAAPFFNAYAIEKLHLNYVWLQILAALSGGVGLISMPLWGYLADKFGNKPLLVMGVWGVLTLPISWILCTAQYPTMMMILLLEINIGGGVFWAVIGLTQFNLLMASSSGSKIAAHAATMSAITGLAGGVAPLVGGYAMHLLSNWHSHLFKIHMDNYDIIFAVATLIRLISLPLLRYVKDDGARSPREVIAQIGRVKPQGWKNIRTMQKTTDADERLKATEALGNSRTQLAVDELSSALQDPSLVVREQAAKSLGEIQDPRSVDALISSLQDQAAGVILETAEALGRIGDRRANGALISLLNNQSTQLAIGQRRAIIGALGRLGGVDAEEALLQQLQSGLSSEMEEAVVEALGHAGTEHAASILAGFLASGSCSPGLKRVVVRSLGEIGALIAGDSLLLELSRCSADDPVVPLLADALARLRLPNAAHPLLKCLEQQSAIITKNQITHAIGQIMDCGDCVYSLLGMEELTRDTAITKQLKEIGKVEGEKLIIPSLQAIKVGDYKSALSNLHKLALVLQLRLDSSREIVLHLTDPAADSLHMASSEKLTIVCCIMKSVVSSAVFRV